MIEREHSQTLLHAANIDLMAVRGMVNDTEHFSDEIFGFHVQQAVEKSLKAWIAYLKIEYPISHDLEGLYLVLEKRGYDVHPFFDLIQFTPFAVEFRYDPDSSNWDSIDRHAVLVQVENLVGFIEKIVQ